MKNKWWVAPTEYYSANLLARLTNKEQAVMSRPYRVQRY